MASDGALDDDARRAAEAAARRGYGKLIACLAAQTRDLAEAEDALSQAFARALEVWPIKGTPRSPEAWLLTAARRRAADAARRGRTRSLAAPHLSAVLDEIAAAREVDPEIPDERLRLIFACAHPAIDPAARAPLILQTVLGFDAARIASAFLVSPAAMAQRLVRAKLKIKGAGIPFDIPGPDQAAERLEAVLDAVYAVFTQGWTDPAGADPRSRGLVEEALWLGELIAALAPDAAEPLGLLALMLHAHARRAARRTDQGAFIPLDEQDPRLWDSPMIAQAEVLMLRAVRLGRVGRFQLEAAIQSAHAYRRLSGQTDWGSIVGLYDALLSQTGSVVAALNRAVAVGRHRGPQAGLEALDGIAEDARLRDYQPYWAARADLLDRCGRVGDAAAAYMRALGLESDPAVRAWLQARMQRAPA